MKKLLFVALGALFCLGSAAQNDEVDTLASETTQKSSVGSSPSVDEQTLDQQLVAVTALIDKLKQITLNGDGEQSLPDVPEEIYMPIRGKSKFTRRHHIYQTLDISPTASNDNDPNLPDYTSNGKEVDDDQVDSSLGIGLNFGYSLIFVPGREDSGQLRLNRMGFAYNVGLVASFSKQEKYGTTCNFLLKSGIETGNGHAMGIGFDVLGGYGKSTGDSYLTVYNEEDADDLAEPYTAWCWQYGAQLWLRSDLLKTAVKNAEMLIFARLVRSVNPNGEDNSFFIENELAFDNYWKDESWSFGVTFRYKF